MKFHIPTALLTASRNFNIISLQNQIPFVVKQNKLMRDTERKFLKKN